MKSDFTISIIGAGRFGSFFGHALSRHFRLVYYDRDKGRSIKNDFGAERVSLEKALSADYIFLTIPIRYIADFLKENGSKIKPGSVITDCASVKEQPVKWMKEYLAEEVYFAGSHPLFGPDSAAAGLRGQKISLSPGRIPYTKYMKLNSIFTDNLGLEVLGMSPSAHDKLMAYNLSIIHHLGRTFDKMDIYKIPLKMAGLSKINSIANVVMHDSDELFRDFYKYNMYAHPVREKFLESFAEVSKMLGE